MKILFVNSYYYPNEIGGAEKAVRTIAEQAVLDGHEAVVLSLSADGTNKTEIVNGVKVYYLRLANMGSLHFSSKSINKLQKLFWYLIDSYNLLMGKHVERILQQEQPDVIETNNLQGFSVSAWKAAKNSRIPVVQILHDYYLSCINSTMYTKGRNCETQCLHCKGLCAPRRWYSSIPSVVSSVSRRTFHRIHSAGTFPKSTPVVYSSSAINLQDLVGESEYQPHKAGDALVVGFLGRLEPLKGVDVLLEAMSQFREGSVRLLVAGGGNAEYLEDLQKRYASPNIEFLGIVSPKDLFSKIHLLIVPSVWEDPLPRVIAESHASGIPVAISKIGGMPEIVEDGVTGYYFEANNPKAISDLLQRLRGENLPTAEQRAKCRERTSHFKVETVYAHHKQLWLSALGK